jgi:hypothetical protein
MDGSHGAWLELLISSGFFSSRLLSTRMAWLEILGLGPWGVLFVHAGSLRLLLYGMDGIESNLFEFEFDGGGISRTRWRPSMPVLGASEFVFMKKYLHALHNLFVPVWLIPCRRRVRLDVIMLTIL